LLKVDAASFESTLAMIQQAELARAITNMQNESLRNGNSGMTPDEINAEIRAARLEAANPQ